MNPIQKIIGSVIIVLSLSQCRPADIPSYRFVENHIPIWEESIKQVIAIAKSMPEENYSYRPTDSVMTFAEQLVHIAIHSKEIASWNLNDKRLDERKRESKMIAVSGKINVIEFVRYELNQVTKIFEGASDQKLVEMKTSFIGNEMTRQEGLIFVHDHLSNHKAKINLYLRLNNIIPPSYTYY